MITSLLQDLIKRMRNLHQILLQEYGLEARCLFRDWERLQLRASNYKHHRIFTLRCLHKELIPVSIKLKSTLKTEKAKKIIRKAEKDLLQARIKAINSILDNVAKQTEECRSQLASIISAQRLRECQGFLDKVGEMRFTKVKQRQLNKYNILFNKKEGNITRANATTPTNSSNLASQAQLVSIISAQRLRECQGFIDKVGEIRFTKVKQRQLNMYNILFNKKEENITRANAITPTNSSNLASQASRQASTLLLPGEGSNLSQAGKQAVALLPPREGSNLTQAGAHLPSREVSSSSQVGRQAGALLPPGEGSNLSQAGSQAGALIPPGEGSSSSQATAYLPPREGISISQTIAHLPPREGSNSPLAIAHLPTREGSNSPPATAHLPPREGSSSSQATAHLPSRDAGSSSQATAHLPPGEGNSSSHTTTHPSPGEGRGNSQAGQGSNQARSGRQCFRHSIRHRAPQASQENSAASQAYSTNSWEDNPTPTISSRLPQGSSNEEPNPKWVINLSSKPLTPAQRSVLAKGPNFAVSPGQPPYCHRRSLY